jgi:hypothetical protein
MEITPMGGGEERMAFAIMQEQQRSAAQDLARAPDQAAGDQMIGVHRFLVPIQVEGGWWLAWLRRCARPEPGGPGGQRIGERFVTPGTRHLREKPLGMPITVCLLASGQQR